MARKTDVRYIRFYTDGSAARKVDYVGYGSANKTLPKKKKQKKIVLYVDPVAVLGIVTALVMLVVMTVSMFMLYDAQNQAQVMEQRVEQLRVENEALEAEYQSGYDLEQVERTALALGMVPKAQVQHIQLHVDVPTAKNNANAWDQFCAFLSGLFA